MLKHNNNKGSQVKNTDILHFKRIFKEEMKLKKRIFSIILTLCMALSLMPMSVLATDGDETVIYVNGVDGDDLNDGETDGNAVETVAQAYVLAEQHGATTIIVCGDTSFEITSEQSYNKYIILPEFPITFEAVNGAELIIPTGGNRLLLQEDTTFRNLTLVLNHSSTQLVANGHTLIFDEGFEKRATYGSGTGFQVIGGTYYSTDLNLNIKEGGNVILKSGTFDAVNAGPGGNESYTAAIIDNATHKVHVTGDAIVTNLYGGLSWWRTGSSEVQLGRSEITMDSDDAEITQIWAGGWWPTPSSDDLSVTQDATSIRVEAGSVNAIFAGSLGQMVNSWVGSHVLTDVEIDITGTADIFAIISGGILMWRNNTANVLDCVENVTIKSDIDLTGTHIFSSGGVSVSDVNSSSTSNRVETGSIEFILTGNGGINSNLRPYSDLPAVNVAERRIFTIDNITSEVARGFNELNLKNGGKAILAENLTFEVLSSDGDAENTLIFQKDSSGTAPVLTLNNAVNSTSSILMDFIDESKDKAAPVLDEILIAFAIENMADESKFLLNPANTNNLYFYSISKSDNGLLVKHIKLPTITPPTAGDVTRGQTLANSTLSGGSATINNTLVSGTFSWADTTTVVSTSGEYDVIFTPDDTSNFEIVSGIKVSVTATSSSGSGGGGSNGGGSGTVKPSNPSPGNPNGSFDGNADTFEKESDKGLEFTVQKNIVYLKEVRVDGNLLTRNEDYRADGSTKVTLYPAYLETLSVGKHTLVVYFTDGTSTTSTFTITGAGIPFADVSENDWFVNGVMYSYDNGFMVGTSTSPMLFSPNMAITRGMVVTVLYRMADSPDVSALNNLFDDVANGQWYTDAVIWAHANGVVAGYGDGTFGPTDVITREQMAVMFANYQNFSGQTPANVFGEKTFADKNSISTWANDAVNKLVMQGIISGKPDNMFDPKATATRAEFATVLMRYIESIDSEE